MIQIIQRIRYLTSLMLVLLLVGCGGMKDGVLSNVVQEPKVSIDKIGVSGLSANSVDLMLTMKVNNPNSYALALSGYDYDVKFNELQLVKGSTDKGFRVPAGATDRIKIPLNVAFKDVAKIYKSMGDSNQVNYDANVDLRLDAPVLNLFKLNTQKQGAITIPRLPKVAFGNIKVKKFSFTDIQLALDMAVDNPNDFAMSLKDIIYN
ncbi:MAG: LEA type 2 family protein, partial [Pseudomonadales bacterium]|nr:LEA type 2 family protein [Pseudomonadales bacterium]